MTPDSTRPAEDSDQPSGRVPTTDATTIADAVAAFRLATVRLETVRARHLELTAERRDLLRQMHAAGLSWRAVWREVGMSTARVHAIASADD